MTAVHLGARSSSSLAAMGAYGANWGASSAGGDQETGAPPRRPLKETMYVESTASSQSMRRCGEPISRGSAGELSQSERDRPSASSARGSEGGWQVGAVERAALAQNTRTRRQQRGARPKGASGKMGDGGEAGLRNDAGAKRVKPTSCDVLGSVEPGGSRASDTQGEAAEATEGRPVTKRS